MRVHVRNKLITTENVENATVKIMDQALSAVTNANGIANIDISALADGDYSLRITPQHYSNDPVGPSIADEASPPDRIYKQTDITLPISGGRIDSTRIVATSPGTVYTVAAGGTTDVLTIDIQPVWIRSPNKSDNRDVNNINRIVIHHTAGSGYPPPNFVNSGGLSAHYVIGQDGTIVKMVREKDTAWHAGCSYWANQYGINSRSIGIEIVHSSGTYPAAQYTALIDLLNRLLNARDSPTINKLPNLTRRGVVGHSDIATEPQADPCPHNRLGRKSRDPGTTFEWTRLESANIGMVPDNDIGIRPGSLTNNNGNYNCFFNLVPGGELRQGDNDNSRTYGGSVRTDIKCQIIKELQTDLFNIGYFVGTPDGDFGSKTHYAVMMFQIHFLSGGTGRVNVDTAEKIKKVLGKAYGGFDLQRGDYDSSQRWGGSVRSDITGKFVEQLQKDLIQLGFRIVGTADRDFGRRTEWAVREFQIYAKMANIAQETQSGPGAPSRYVDRLSQVANTQQYTGHISGVVNQATRSALQYWLSNCWRCPVIVEAWNMAGGNRSTLHTENIWLHNEVNSTAPRMFVRDFSNYYTFPAGRNPDDLIVLGDYAAYVTWEGPRSVPPGHTWAEGELLPEHLIGTNLAGLTAQQRSTFKVVRAVSEVECFGFFDSVNAYDNAFVSLGPCHWTLGITNGAVEEGELCGYLAYLRNADPAAFRQAIENFGMRVDEDWVDAGVQNGRNLFKSGSRKYAGWVALQQNDGSFSRMAQTEADGNYFKTWHWFYRFVMAGRTINGFRRRQWHMARVRIRDIRATQWPAGVVPDVPLPGGGTRRATIGDVYTSEKAVALLLRWHIRFPSHVIRGGVAATHLRNAFGLAAIPAAAGDPTTWTDAHETALINGIMQEVNAIGNANLINTMTEVRDWPTWAAGANPRGYSLNPGIGNLADTRNSLQFDDTDLPLAPY